MSAELMWKASTLKELLAHAAARTIDHDRAESDEATVFFTDGTAIRVRTDCYEYDSGASHAIEVSIGTLWNQAAQKGRDF